MKIVIAVDKFKGSCDQHLLSQMITDAISSYSSEIFVRSFFAADGGEGTLTVFEELGWRTFPIEVCDPLRRTHISYFMVSPDGKKIAIELSRICGSKFLVGKNSPLISDTYGLGQAIAAAIEENPEEIIIGLGGSASNDLGLGIFQALDLINTKAGHTGLKAISKVKNFKLAELAALRSKTEGIKFTVLHDTNAFLTGKNGAIRVFGKQKGLNLGQRHLYDRIAARWIRNLERKFGIPLLDISGLGAAGGVGAALYTLFNPSMTNGPEYLLSLSGFFDHASKTDLIVTGEGRFDKSSLTGKLTMSVVEYGEANNIPVVLLCAQVDKQAVLQANSVSSRLTVIPLCKFSDSTQLSEVEIRNGIRIGIHRYLGQLESTGHHI